ncbi:hypothetical protein DL96DRAFT_1583547 [Flagelloscypha sp. PMI_526]|nr:hypothetical protein DL96DRAFT_1583547 [Flagelloscypha sp. PMI_526]
MSSRHRTYGRRDKQRWVAANLPDSNFSGSASVEDIVTTDPDVFTSFREARSHVLKRSRSVALADASILDIKTAKRARSASRLSHDSALDSPMPSQAPSLLMTPYPSELASALKFTLPSSRPQEPGELSPMPLMSSFRKHTSSKNLKENKFLSKYSMSNRPMKRMPSRTSLKSLDSPFSSRPGSAFASPDKDVSVTNDHASLKHTLRPCHSFTSSPAPLGIPKRTLSDPTASPVFAQSPVDNYETSITNSAAPSSIRTRRPSAPTLHSATLFRNSRTEESDPVFSSDPFALFPSQCSTELPDTNNSSLSFLSGSVDFNRPPSSLSFYERHQMMDMDLDDEEHFSVSFYQGVGGCSTPYSDIFPRRFSLANEMDISPTKSNSTSASWITDSLISPPSSFDVPRTPERVKSWPTPSMTLDVEKKNQTSGLIESNIEVYIGPENAKREDDLLKSMFQELNVDHGSGLRTRLPSSASDTTVASPFKPSSPLRARSLENVPLTPPMKAVKGRDRRGTIRASDFLPSFARRSRSGSVAGAQPPSPTSDKPASSSSSTLGSKHASLRLIDSTVGDDPGMVIEQELSFAINEDAEESDDELLLKAKLSTQTMTSPRKSKKLNRLSKIMNRKVNRTTSSGRDDGNSSEDELNLL